VPFPNYASVSQRAELVEHRRVQQISKCHMCPVRINTTMNFKPHSGVAKRPDNLPLKEFNAIKQVPFSEMLWGWKTGRT
jgi:hypothetical protein